MDKKILGVGVLSYLILTFLSLLFYIERTAFIDIAFHLFYIIKDNHLAIQNFRFGALFTQLFPLLGYRMGLSLENIMQCYSVGFVLYYFVIFLCLLKWTKSYKFAIIMLLFNLLMITHTFYWIQSELPQGIAFLFLFFSFIMFYYKENRTNSVFYLPLFSVMLLFLMFFHPLIIFPFTFILLFLYFDKQIDIKQLTTLGLTFVVFFVIKFSFFKTNYDSSSMGGIKNIFTFFPDYFSLKSNDLFLKYVIKDYYFLILSFFIIIGHYVYSKNFRKLVLFVSFFLGYLLVVNVSYPNGGEQYYMENLYLPLSVFVIFPIVFDLISYLKENWVLGLLIFIILVRIAHIGLSHRIYTDRINYLYEFLEQTESEESKKLIISDAHFHQDTLMMTWGSPYEFWLLSTIKTGKTRSIVITENPSDLEWTLPYNKKFVTKWGNFDYAELPEKYFILNDTTFYIIKK